MKKSKFKLMRKGNVWIIVGLSLLIILGIITALFVVLGDHKQETKIPTKSICGDSICDESEGCYNCSIDCKCAEDEYCSPEKNKCILPVCGNGICESFEGPDSCCLDCPCTIPAEICNNESLICEIPKFPLSDENVKEIAINYSESIGFIVENTEIVNTGEYNGNVVRIIRVSYQGEEWFTTYGITEEGQVIELPVA